MSPEKVAISVIPDLSKTYPHGVDVGTQHFLNGVIERGQMRLLTDLQRIVFYAYYNSDFLIKDVSNKAKRDHLQLLIETGFSELFSASSLSKTEAREVKPLKIDDRRFISTEKRRAGQRGKRKSPESNKKRSKAVKEHWSEHREERVAVFRTPEHREKMRISSLGRAQTEKTKKKLSSSRKKHWRNPEYRAKLKAIQESPEYKRKISEAHKGKYISVETRRKIAEGNRRRAQKNRVNKAS